MPGTLHQGTLELFRHDPWLAFDLLGIERPVAGTPIDRRAEVERGDPARPGQVESNYPDLVLVHEDPLGGVVICVEAQGKLDRLKRWMLPYYQAAVAKDHKLPTWLVVVSYCDRMSAALAAWEIGAPPLVNALVLNAKTVPRMVDLERARQWPTASVLAATVHGCRGDIEAARMGICATLGLPVERRVSYRATILSALHEPHRHTLIGEMNMEHQDELWDIERRSGTFLVGREEGRAEGRRTTLVELILTVFDVRGVRLNDQQEAQVRSCNHLGTLERWARLARDVQAPTQLFEQG
ncbi:hypothetical protein [Enhygromyxa salina]|nr:hypothetical protein [Enhygromyxa salina]